MSTAAIILTVYLGIGFIYSLVICSYAYLKGDRKGLWKLFLGGMVTYPFGLAVLVMYYFLKKGDEE